MKKVVLVGLILMLAACAKQQNQTTTEEPPTTWVYDPEPWTSAVDTEKPNILSIGDSISGGYLPELTRQLPGFDIMHPNDNCRNSTYTLLKLDEWLQAMPNNQIILWNNGVWDSTAEYWRDENHGDTPKEYYTTPLDLYESNLIAIARKLKATGSRVVFVTTTHIIGPPFIIGNELKLNEIAKRVLPSEGVEIMDLYPISASIPNAHPNQWDVHFTRQTNVIFGTEIAKFLKKEK